jgi:hypothetical protein
MNYDQFVEVEYTAYKLTTDDPMEFDDWFFGSDYLEQLFNQLNTGAKNG